MKIEDINKSYDYCRSLALNHYENFPVASILFPRKNRKHIYSIYAFARKADDIADSIEYSSDKKIQHINEFENDFLNFLDDITKVKDSKYNLILLSLIDTIKKFNIPRVEFLNLLKAFKQDALKSHYNTFDELLDYSKLSANPIGHLVLYVAGYKPAISSELFEMSDKICSALQLTNFWQDVSIDLQIGRVYIPISVMDEFKYNEELLKAKIENDNFKNLMHFLLKQTHSLFVEGSEITSILNGRLRYEFKAIYNGGIAILNKIIKSDFEVLTKRVSLNRTNKLLILVKSIFRIASG